MSTRVVLYTSGFEKFKEELPSKEKFYCSLMGKKLVIRSISMIFRFRIDFK